MNVVYFDQFDRPHQGQLVPHPTMAGYEILLKANGKQFSMEPGGVDGERDPNDPDPNRRGSGLWEAAKRDGHFLTWTTGHGDESYARLITLR